MNLLPRPRLPVSIRSRLLWLVLSVLLPALAIACWVIVQTYNNERNANERLLRETARALSIVVDRELSQRAAIARVLSAAPIFDAAPRAAPAMLAEFEEQARRAMDGMEGGVVLSTPERVLLDTRGRAGGSPVRTATPLPWVTEPFIGTVKRDTGAGGEELTIALVQPVRRKGETVFNLAVTMLPGEMQRLLDQQRLPADWYGTVMDSKGTVVARHPGGARYVGRSATPDIVQRMAATRESLFDSVSLDGVKTTGFFSTSPQGWAYLMAMPRAQFSGWVPEALWPVLAGGLALFGLAITGALWVSRGIAGPVFSLKRAAALIQAGQAVEVRPTGMTECDEVLQGLSAAAQTIASSHAHLEKEVADAIEKTRLAEQHISQNQRVEALGRLTGGVAHDFNNLLGVVSNSAHLMARHAAGSEALQAPLAATLRAVEAGSRLTQHLLRIAGRQPVRPQVMALKAFMGDVKELMEVVLGKRIAVAVDVAEDTRDIEIDAGELELALVNIAINARDAMPGGGQLTLSARNALPEEAAGLQPRPHVLITVSDTGSGMESSLVDHVFEPFFTTKAVDKGNGGKGTGLGLSQVYGFCVQAGGTARLRSTPGKGTTVSLVLPARQGGVAGAGAVPAADAAVNLHGCRVLLVEDNEDLADATEALLDSYGMRITRAANADEALAALESGASVDVLLSDIVMPGSMDGIALAWTLRRRRPELPVVLITGYSRSLEAAKGFTVLRKPCAPAALVAALAQAMQEQPVDDEAPAGA